MNLPGCILYLPLHDDDHFAPAPQTSVTAAENVTFGRFGKSDFFRADTFEKGELRNWVRMLHRLKALDDGASSRYRVGDGDYQGPCGEHQAARDVPGYCAVRKFRGRS